MRTAVASETSLVEDGSPLALPSFPPKGTVNTVVAAGPSVSVSTSGTDMITTKNPLYEIATVNIPFIISDTVLVEPVATLTGPLSVPAPTTVGTSVVVPAGGAASFIYTLGMWYVLASS